MFKFSFRREKDKEFKHIAHGLIPAASIAPKPAVPRTPPPRSPNPSPERPRSALAAAILSSSLTGQAWALPPVRPRSFSESGLSESFISEPNISTALFNRDRWSEDLASRPRLSSPDLSEEEELQDEEEELQDEEELVGSEDEQEEHVYQTLGKGHNCPFTEPVYSLPLKHKTSTPQRIPMSGRRVPSPDLPEETVFQSPEASADYSRKKASVRRSPRSLKKDVPCRSALPIPTTNQSSQSNISKPPIQQSPGPIRASIEGQREAAWASPENNVRMVDEQKLLEERLQRLEQEISNSQSSTNARSSAGSHAELLNLRQHAQELVDENDALKLTVHRLNVELSRYQTQFRPLSKQESSRISSVPKTGSPPPGLLDMKYLSPLLLAYEDRMSEKDALLQTTEEDVKRLRVHVEEVIKENEKLHKDITKIGGVSQKNCHQIQQQALLVLQENQVLLDQLEAQHGKAKASTSRHQAEVSKVSRQLMLIEAEKQSFQEELEESRREALKNGREVQVLQARLKDAITWDEHCGIAGKLRRQLEQQESKNKSEMDDFLIRLSSLQEENRSLAVDKANLTADVKRMEAEQELTKQANRKAERKMSVLNRQKEECVVKEERTRHYMGAVISVAEHISQERDQLIKMASLLQQEKQGFVSRILKGTVRFGKLQEEVKVYRSQASTRLAGLEEAAEGRTASYQREILHLQRLLRERQDAEERLLQSKREIEEELEVVWQAATRENQQIRDTLLDLRPSVDLSSIAWPSPAQDEANTSARRQEQSSSPLLFTSHESPGLQRRSIFKSDSGHQNTSLDEKHKHGLDYYC
ncbi:centrosomal protein of 89 kDa isoform X1 [Pseudochaenichthys georgianus]|uniref:centrosomal protein of 89 kDa isoform X1 n=1 Tax=Pseudochaenichthys georgianus TaxID=52239 RepID=UPI00146CA571|nr:centrosomal protein of 89 kDa isoform X1 [Pseudochaenichthys georgianus]